MSSAAQTSNKLTMTQFWMIAAAILVIMAILGWVLGKYMNKDMNTTLMYTGISVVVGVAVSTTLFFTVVDRTAKPGSGYSANYTPINAASYQAEMQ